MWGSRIINFLERTLKRHIKHKVQKKIISKLYVLLRLSPTNTATSRCHKEILVYNFNLPNEIDILDDTDITDSRLPQRAIKYRQ